MFLSVYNVKQVQEIQLRQKNWMEQREAALKQRATSVPKASPGKNKNAYECLL